MTDVAPHKDVLIQNLLATGQEGEPNEVNTMSPGLAPVIEPTTPSPTTFQSPLPATSPNNSSKRRVNVPHVLANSPSAELPLSEYEQLNDPLRNLTDKLTFYNKLKLYGYGAFAIPLKVGITIGILALGCIIGKLARIGLKKERKGEPVKPLSKTRRFIGKGIRYLSRLLLMNYGFYYIKVIGKRDPNATVIVSNHCGPFEATAHMYFGGCTFVSRIENARIPLLGQILKTIQCIFVDRSNDKSRDDTVTQILERAKSKPGTWPPLLIFPEGTSCNGKAIMKFRVGAFQPGVPVQPSIARFPFKHVDPTWSGENIGMAGLMFRVMTQFYNRMEIQYLPTYYPNEAEKADPYLYAENVRKYMSEKSGIPLSNYSLDDYFVLNEAHKYGIPQSEALLGMEMLRKEANVNAMDVKKIIRAFHELDSSKTGKIRYGPFLTSLGLPDTPVSRTIFAEVINSAHDSPHNSASSNAIFVPSPETEIGSSSADLVTSPTSLMNDKDFTMSTSDVNPKAKTITFRAFLRAIIKITRNISTEDKIAQAFDIVNFTGTGKISKEELIAMCEFASEDTTPAQAKEIYAKMDTRKVGYIDLIEFGSFLRANPIFLAMFEATRQYERAKDLNNPVVQALERKHNGQPVTVPEFREMVKAYRQQVLLSSNSHHSF